MKTKEIDVWVIAPRDKLINEDAKKHVSIHTCKEAAGHFMEEDDEVFKAKLVIELPEKRVLITESEVIKAANDLLLEHGDVTEFLERLGFTE